MVHVEVWYEILVRVDPSFIFDCILICKACLEVITSPEFRQAYRKRWKNNSKLVGFTKHKSGFKLFAAGELGRTMNANKSVNLVDDYFISKSGEGDGLTLYGSLSQNWLFVSQAGEGPTQLMPPAPPDDKGMVDTRWAAAAILSGQNDSYKVILAGTYFPRANFHNRKMKLVIQTFSSSSEKWEKSEESFQITRDSVLLEHSAYIGMASSSRGMVYWLMNRLCLDSWMPEDKLVAISYDANNGCISQVYAPDAAEDVPILSEVNYGLSSQGYFQCAISGHRIDVWGFDDDVNEHKGWKFMHSVYPEPIPGRCVNFMSFFPGKPDSIVVESAAQLFVYDRHTRKNDVVCHSFKEYRIPGGVDLVPLTMADLGVWPSSPFTNTGKTNISSIKQMLA